MVVELDEAGPVPAVFSGVVGARPGATLLSEVSQLAPNVDPF
jgi:hypothetical protein